MTAFERYALQDPIGAGIELGHQAMRDARYKRYGNDWTVMGTRIAARAVLAEGLEKWTHSPALDLVWPQILTAARDYLHGVGRED